MVLFIGHDSQLWVNKMKHSQTPQWTNVITQQKAEYGKFAIMRERQRDSVTFPTLEVFCKGEGFVCMKHKKSFLKITIRIKLESTELCAKRTEGLIVSMDSLIIQAHK